MTRKHAKRPGRTIQVKTSKEKEHQMTLLTPHRLFIPASKSLTRSANLWIHSCGWANWMKMSSHPNTNENSLEAKAYVTKSQISYLNRLKLNWYSTYINYIYKLYTMLISSIIFVNTHPNKSRIWESFHGKQKSFQK